MQRKQSARTPAATGSARKGFKLGAFVTMRDIPSRLGIVTRAASGAALGEWPSVTWADGTAGQYPGAMLRAAKRPLGFVLYDGPSAIDGAPVVAIVNAIDASTNGKTGAIVQSWILRADVDPVAAARAGADASVCGRCVHRPRLAASAGAARCYVNLGRAPLGVFRAYQRGRYVVAAPAFIAAAVAGRTVRLGSYGDPAAIPADRWRAYVSRAAGYTGYSHQWRDVDAAEWAPLVMASVDSIDEQREAASRGFRTFRVSLDAADLQRGAETMCPASREAGARAQCADCLLCGGTSKRARSIRILDHAVGWKRRVINIRAVGA